MSRELKWGAVVFAVALVVRLILLAKLLPDLRPDANPDYYRELGRNLAAGRGFVATDADGQLRLNIGRTPGYPIFLAGLIWIGGDKLGLFLAVNCLLAAVTCGLTVWLAARWLPPLGAGIAGLITALDPNSVVRCFDVKAEMLFSLLLILGALLLAWKTRRLWAWGAAGVLWSLAALCRPIAMWLPVVALVAAIVWRVRWTWWAVFLIGFVPLIGVSMAHNAALTGRWMLSTAGPYNLIMSWATGIEAARTDRPPEVVQQLLVKQVGLIEFYRDRQDFERMLRDHREVALGIIISAPALAIEQGLLGIGRALIGPGARSLEYAKGRAQPASPWWTPLYCAGLVCLLALSFWGAIRLGRDGWLLTALVVYFVVLSCGPMTNSRFRYPVVPMLAILAVAGITGQKKDPCRKTSS
jgi:4-amino-4-deoxy-L-arabinose transferase-like glycosyltransferase